MAQQRVNGLCSPWCQTLQALVYHWCPSSCHSGAAESVGGFPRRNCLGLQRPPPPTQSPLVFTAIHCGDLPSWHWNPELGSLGLGLLAPEISLPNCYPCWCGASLFHVWAPPISLDGCGFFSSLVVKTSIQLNFWHSWVMVVLHFSCNFDVIVRRGGHVCLHCHLDWKLLTFTFTSIIWGALPQDTHVVPSLAPSAFIQILLPYRRGLLWKPYTTAYPPCSLSILLPCFPP